MVPGGGAAADYADLPLAQGAAAGGGGVGAAVLGEVSAETQMVLGRELDLRDSSARVR